MSDEIEDLIYAFDLLTWLDAEGVRYWESGKNVSRDWIGIQHNYGLNSCGDHSNHMGVHSQQKNFKCWKCSHKGGAINLIMEVKNCNFPTALRTLGEYQKWFVPVPDAPNTTQTNFSLPETASSDFKDIHLDLLIQRGYDPDIVIPKYDLLATCDDDKWGWRIIIPVKIRKRIVSFIGMDVTGHALIKYKVCPNDTAIIKRNEIIYGIDDIKHRGMLVEGVLDKWRIGQNCASVLTIQWTKQQVNALLEHPCQEWIIAFDGEPLAIKQAERLGEALSYTGKKVEILELPDGKDPDSLKEEDVLELQRMLM